MRMNPSVTFFCHGDSSTGLMQPLEEISNILKKYDCLLLVDAVASIGAAPLCMDQLGIDVLYSGSQKILNAPPGLSPISFSHKAVEKVKARKNPVTSFYMDCLLLGNYWKCDDGPVIYHHTAPISLVYALREALSILAHETLQKSWEKHEKFAEMLHKKLEEMGLTLFIKEKAHRLPSVTTIEIPKEVNGQKVVQLMRTRFGIDIAGGLGSTAGKVWRIGLMGYNCNEKNVNQISVALSSCIQSSLFRNKL